MNGTLERVGDKLVLRYERRLRHPPEKVWRALVEPEHLAAWFPTRIEGTWRQGARLRFVFEGEESYPSEGTIHVYDPPKVLEYSWEDERLRYELTPDGEGCRLVFTTTVSERSIAPRDGSGWHACLDGLEAALDGKPARSAEFRPELYAEYVERLGLGDFPAFLRAGAPVADALGTPGMEGWIFEGQGGVRLELLRATRDAETAERAVEGSAYLLLLEGEYVLRLGGKEFVLKKGTEFQIPPGGKVGGRVVAGTRMIHGRTG